MPDLCQLPLETAVSGNEPRGHVPDTGNNFSSFFWVVLQWDSFLHLQTLSLGTWQDFKSKVSQMLPQRQTLAETWVENNCTAGAYFKKQELLEHTLILGILQINGPGAKQDHLNET